MFTSESYIKNTIKLVKSFTIKHNDIAVHINNELIRKYGTSILGSDPYDKTNWKYYMNICGIYHPIDNPIKITIIETGLVKDLSKAILEEYPITKDELLKHDVYYDDLIKKYPNDELLIKGMIYNNDLETVINLEDGFLMSYSKHYVEEQESNLISDISKFSINFFKRWHIREYIIVDNLYLASLLATLFTKLVLKVINIRYANIMTSNVHSFHVLEFFKSHFNVDTSVLNKSTRFWLYKNMRYIRKHIGSNETLNIIIDKILTNNGIGVSEIELINSLPDIQLMDLNDVSKPLYDIKTNSFISKSRNKYYFYSDSDVLTGYQMLYLQFNKNLVENDSVIKHTEDIENKYLHKFDRNILNRQKTKTFKIKLNKNNIILQDVTFKIILDNLVHLSMNDMYRTVKKIIDPNTGVIYNITPKQAVYMIFKLIANLNNLDNPIINGYSSNHTINSDITKEMLNDNLLRADLMEEINNKLYDNIPKINTYIATDNFKPYIETLLTYNSLIWNLASNSSDMFITSNLQIVYKRLHKRLYIHFDNNKTIDDLLSDVGLYFNIENNYDSIEMLKVIIYEFTGFKIIDNEIIEKLNKYVNITKNLSSYSIQFITDENDLNILPMRYNSLDTINAGIIDIHDTTFRALEDFYGTLDGNGILYMDFIDLDMDVGYLLDKTLSKMNLIAYDTRLSNIDKISSLNDTTLVASNETTFNLFKPTVQVDTNANTYFNIFNNNLLRGEKLNNNLTLVVKTDDTINVINDDIVTNIALNNVNMFKPKIESNNYIVRNEFVIDNYELLNSSKKIDNNILLKAEVIDELYTDNTVDIKIDVNEDI